MILVEQFPAAIVAALFAAAAFLIRGRCSPGVAESWLAAGLTLAALTAYVDAASPPALFAHRVGRALAALALIWLASSAVGRTTAGARASIHAAASTWCWLAAHACLLSGPPGGAADAVVLLLAALAASRVAPTAAGGAYALLPVVCLARAAFPALERTTAATLHPVSIALLLSLLALVAVVGDGLRRWQRRRAAWLTQPEHLADDEQPPRELAASATLVGSIAGLLVAAAPPTLLTALALFAAALAVLNAFHRVSLPIAGTVGLALAAGATAHAFAAIARIWPPPFGDSPAVPLSAANGLCVASLHLSWLAGFWRQQLRNGAAWTTAGRLIPAARQLAGVAAAGAAVIGVAQSASASAGAVPSAGALIIVSGLLLLAAGRMLRSRSDGPTRDVDRYTAHSARPPADARRLSSAAASVAGLALIGAYFDAALGVRGCAWLLIALLVLTWQRGQCFDEREPDIANAAAFGLLPAALLAALLVWPSPSLALWIPAAGAAVYTAWLRR
ncbi:MAG: hypothetical protein CHACPFDD_00679 [Phycisphaerae bacterium]|nr:hypothetical protein [Phycisphaerae bacterium]